MVVTLNYSPTGTLVIEVADTCLTCQHAHPTEAVQWDTIIREASAWMAKHSPVCRHFSGVLPWARTESPTSGLPSANPPEPPPTRITEKEATVLMPSLPSTGVSHARPSSTDSSEQPPSKKNRSFLGCTTCKLRKIKCDEKRPKCGNCQKKRGRRCEYSYTVIPSVSTSQTEVPIGQQEGKVAESQQDMSVVSIEAGASDTVELESTNPSSGGAELPMMSDSVLSTDSTYQGGKEGIDYEWLSRCVDEHSLTWFIDASDVVDRELYASQQRNTTGVGHRQAILAHCWSVFLWHQGQVPLRPFEMAHDPAGLMLLYAFLSVGATHYSYMRKIQNEPYEDHYRAARTLGGFAYDLAPLAIQSCTSAEGKERIALAFGLAVVYGCSAADPIGLKYLRQFGDYVVTSGGPMAIANSPGQIEVPSLALLDDVASGVIADSLVCLLGGRPMTITPDGEWLDHYVLAHRFVKESFGISIPMGKYIVETAVCLYNPEYANRMDKLTALRHDLNKAVATICSSPQSPLIQMGDMVYRNTLLCLIELDGFGRDPNDSVVTEACDSILELFSESISGGFNTVRWLVPAIIGSTLCNKDRRSTAEALLTTFQALCESYDIEYTVRLVKEVWARRDSGQRNWRWTDIFVDHPDWHFPYI